MVLSRSSSRVAAALLAAAGAVSVCGLDEGFWRAGFHPFAVLAALLPLQLAALLWCVQASPTAAAHRSSGMRPPASD